MDPNAQPAAPAGPACAPDAGEEVEAYAREDLQRVLAEREATTSST